MIWQLDDCWPVTSWAAVDGEGRLKPLHHEMRRLYADRLLTLQERAGSLAACLVDQSGAAWVGEAVLRRTDAKGTVRAEQRLPFGVPAREVGVLPLAVELVPARGRDDEFLVLEAEGLRAFWFPVRDKDFAYPHPGWDVDVRSDVDVRNGAPAQDAVEATVTAHTLLRDLLLQPDRLAPDVTCDTGLTTLLPGERHAFTVHGRQDPAPRSAAEALFCVNTNVAGRQHP